VAANLSEQTDARTLDVIRNQQSSPSLNGAVQDSLPVDQRQIPQVSPIEFKDVEGDETSS
jgi:hypothetical protein